MYSVILLGGDARMRAAAAAFRAAGSSVQCLWMENSPCPAGEALGAYLRPADALVLPVPALTKEGRIRASCASPAPSWAQLRGWLRTDCLVCGGGLTGVDWPRTLDLLTDDAFAVANAVPTALADAMRQSVTPPRWGADR